LLTAVSFQAFHLQRNIEQLEEKTVREFLNRSVPYHLVKPVPAFSILETGLKTGCNEKIMDQTCAFEFVNLKKQKLTFTPLLNTKIINAKLSMVEKLSENVWAVELQSDENIDSLSGLSFYLDTQNFVEIEKITYNQKELPLIKPNQYNELPFTEWFNNAHLLLNQNYYLFGTYDYWQEIFLTYSTKLYYIGQCGKEVFPKGVTNIKLEVTFNSPVNSKDILKINCVPVVNVDKNEVTLDERNPVKELTTETDSFLNFLYVQDFEKDIDNVLVRQYGVERYNSEQLFEQIQEILYRYYADYYAFQNIKELSSTDNLETLNNIMDDIRSMVNKAGEKMNSEQFFAVLKKSGKEIGKIDLKYLTTNGAAGNELKPFSKPLKTPIVCDVAKTSLLMETKGGRNGIKDETQKEAIAKYYFQTKDRLVTPSDITVFIKSFFFNDGILGNEIENILINKEKYFIRISVELKKESYLRELENLDTLTETLQNKITLKSTGILPFRVHIS